MEPIRDAVGTVRYDKEDDVFLVLKPGPDRLPPYWAVYDTWNQNVLLDEDVDKHDVPMIGRLNLK